MVSELAIPDELLAEATPEELEEYVEILEDQRGGRRYWPGYPPSPKQLEFLALDTEEALYGGAAGGGKALTPEHEVLTRDGWRSIAKVEAGDEVVSWDDGQLVYATVTARHDQNFKGRIRTYRGRGSFSFEASPNHRFVTSQGELRASELRRCEIPAAGDPVPATTERYSGDELELWGWWIAEGKHEAFAYQRGGTRRVRSRATVRKRDRWGNENVPIRSFERTITTKEPKVTICQTKPEGRARIRYLIERLGLEYTEDAGAFRVRWTPPEFSGDRVYNMRVPRSLFTELHRQRLLDGLIGGDGGYRRAGWFVSSSSEQLVDDVQELATLMGWRTRKTSKATYRLRHYGVSAYPRRSYRLVEENLGWREYDGPLHCLSVPGPRNFLTRLNGTVHVTGNSDAILMDALKDVHVPGYTALILRRTFRDLALEGAIMNRADLWLRGTDAHWDSQEHRWTFPSGATITFGYMEAESDKYRYQGAELVAIYFDELTQFTETQYLYLHSRARVPQGFSIRPRVRAASNPGGKGHDWVKKRFVDPGDPSRPFVPAKLDDNPGLDKDQYRKQLAKLDPVTRAQLERGDWDVLPEGNMFKRTKAKFVKFEDVPRLRAQVRGWDFAATEVTAGKDPDYTAGALVGWGVDGRIYVVDVVRAREDPGKVEELLKVTAARDGRGVSVRWEEEGGSSGKFVSRQLRAETLVGHDARGIRSTGSKVERAKPLSARWEEGDVVLVTGPWNDEFLAEAVPFPNVPHDDQVDAVSLAYSQLALLDDEVVAPAGIGRESPWSV